MEYMSRLTRAGGLIGAADSTTVDVEIIVYLVKSIVVTKQSDVVAAMDVAKSGLDLSSSVSLVVRGGDARI